MKLMDTGHATVAHQTFRDDGLREQEGLKAELSPPDKLVHPLESRIIGRMGRNTEEDMQMLLTGGIM
ncbi:MAG: hypothetical protein H6R19_21 [Proteobacteria bacterium]|jgi:hypothetical protein|nr:hypothetical protein [Pseudomonadota bacterium]